MSEKERTGLLTLACDLSEVKEAVRQRNHQRDSLFRAAEELGEEILSTRLTDLRESLSLRHGTPREPFPPLATKDLATLEWAMRQAIRSRRYRVLEDEPHGHELAYALTIIRANRVYERHKQSGLEHLPADVVREAIRTLSRVWFTSLLQEVKPEAVAVVMMLRAGLILGEGAHEAGIRQFGSIDAWKIGKTLETHVGSVSLPTNMLEAKVVVLLDSAGATFATIRAGLDVLKHHGVDPSRTRVIIATIDLAPEGLIPFFLDETHVEIVSASRSLHLSAKGLLAEIGIGDMDELVMSELDWGYGLEHWVEAGLIHPDTLARVLERTRLIAGENRRRQMASAPREQKDMEKTIRTLRAPTASRKAGGHKT